MDSIKSVADIMKAEVASMPKQVYAPVPIQSPSVSETKRETSSQSSYYLPGPNHPSTFTHGSVHVPIAQSIPSNPSSAVLPELELVKSLEEESKAQERVLREKLRLQHNRVRMEEEALQKIQTELDRIEEPTRKDVAILMERIELVDRDVAWMQRDYEYKRKAVEASKSALDKKKDEKEMLTKHLGLIITENEEKKSRKLQCLMAQLSNELDGVTDAGATFKGFPKQP